MEYKGISQHIDFCRLPTPGGRYELTQVLGVGTYGEVYRAKDKITGNQVAIKVLETIAENLEEIEEEFLVLRDLSNKHPNLPFFHGIFLKKSKNKDDDQLWFVMELCRGGSITDMVHELKSKSQCLSSNTIAFILRETLDALAFLHENHCMHRDIKGHNILLTEEGNIKLVDFGVSSHLAVTLARRNTSVGTPYFMPPEVIACEQQLNQNYDSRCDVWSLGITAIELAEGEPPLSSLHPMKALFEIPRNKPPELTHKERFSPLLSDFISACLVKDFEKRPFARELLRHPFFKNIDVIKAKKELCTYINKKKQTEHNKKSGDERGDITVKFNNVKKNLEAKSKQLDDDLAMLESVSETIIVDSLNERFESTQIYTYIGDILIACNPFEHLPLYTPHYQQMYCKKTRSENPPHVFAIADAAFSNLMHEKQNQTIVISGESGSGKTESANLLLKQLVYLGKESFRNLEDKILKVNPIMESFGNARTGINSNSSRFGKYLELFIGSTGKLNGARISVYLLEQSRVVKQAVNEGNFHIFYYFYDGLQKENRLEDYYLNESHRSHHNYLKHPINSPKINQEKWKLLKTSFKVVGFKDEDLDSIYRTLAVIINLGDIEFGEMVTGDNTDNKACVIDMAPLLRVSHLLGVDKGDLHDCLTSNAVVMRGETIIKNNTIQEASATRDAMAKSLYGRLFDWIVNHINALLISNTQLNQLSIGLLDIFGFENHAANSYEQLMINIANEQIQYYFNQKIFSWEQQEYMSEGIPINLIEFSDNSPVLDLLLSRPLGLLSLIDEENRFPKSSDRTLIDKFHAVIKSKYYQKPKSNVLSFAIHHYAGRVVYNAEGFLEKNKNFLPPEVVQLIRGSQYDTIRFLFQCPVTKTGNLYSALSENIQVNDNKCDSKEKYNSRGISSQSRVQQTMATYFKYSLMDLLQKMIAGSPLFIRCIKPNDIKGPKYFEKEKVLKQLRYAGCFEAIRIRNNGFSHRIQFADFLKKYCFLAFKFDERVVVSRETCKFLLERLKIEGYALGKSKVFLKYFHVEQLSKMYEERIQKIIIVQSFARRWLAIRKTKKLRQEHNKKLWKLQKNVRGLMNKKRNNDLHDLVLHKVFLDDKNEQARRRKSNTKVEVEDKIHMIMKKNISSAEEKMVLQKENLSDDDILKIIKKSGKSKKERNVRDDENITSASRLKPLSVKEQQLKLAEFAENIHNRNKDIHNKLRISKRGIPLLKIGEMPADYRRPPGFELIPGNFYSTIYLSDFTDSG
ncbi:hypothetical protein ACKWTF_007349 [Chironomus riparius]